MANIVQVEFFHIVGTEQESIESLLFKCYERVTDGSRIKTVIRFFDEDGSITDLMLKAKQVEKEIGEFFNSPVPDSFLPQRIKGLRLNRLARKNKRLKKRAILLTAKRLPIAIWKPYAVSIEQSDHSFRFVQNNEKHELTEAISRTSGAWIFLFESGPLISDKNKVLAHVM